jgi:hypothetical protein
MTFIGIKALACLYVCVCKGIPILLLFALWLCLDCMLFCVVCITNLGYVMYGWVGRDIVWGGGGGCYVIYI